MKQVVTNLKGLHILDLDSVQSPETSSSNLCCDQHSSDHFLSLEQELDIVVTLRATFAEIGKVEL